MGKESSRVGVRELRQNLSVYLRRVDAGETLEVTERGRPVALLVPLPASGTAVERLIASGLVSQRATLDPSDLGLPPGPLSRELSGALEESRADRI
jgi:prevent-host-death family protein